MRIDARQRMLFEDRYGPDWHRRLTELMAEPCVSFAAIAEKFGVSRERVRQWHADFFPDAASGGERRRQCRQARRRARTKADPRLRAFARDARQHLRVTRITVVDDEGRAPLRVRVLGRVVVLRTASSLARAARMIGAPADADFVYCLLPDETFVLARPGEAHDLGRYSNSFAAFGRIDAASSQCA